MHFLRARQHLKISIDEAWSFLQDPHNLSEITPPSMGFEITSDTGHETWAGQLITYRVYPFPFVPTRWVTEITHVNAPTYFVDEQRVGPYRIWHHEHELIPQSDGSVVMEDRIGFRLPFEPFTSPLVPILVRPRLRQIFDHRREILASKWDSDASHDLLEFS